MTARIREEDAVGRLTGGATGCLGAVFLTYTFDATFFEEEVLASVLSLQEDPAEAAHRFLAEGRRRLVEAPVVVIAEPDLLRGGQRLPYDLLRADPARTFHPKLALLLYPSGARLVVGSGNLTPGGYGGNAELSVALTLDYAGDASLLRDVVEFLVLCGARGEAWTRWLAELEPRLGPRPRGPGTGPRLLHTLGPAPLLEAFLGVLPPEARIERIGVLAPFHQEDGAPPDRAVLERLLETTEGRRARGFALDLGVSWEGNAVAPRGPVEGGPDAHVGELWGFVDGDPGKETTRWAILGPHEGWSFGIDDGRDGGAMSTRELRARCATGRAWPVGPVEAFAPEGLVARAAARTRLRLWLHPEAHRRDGRLYRQPLHGKLLAVTVREGTRRRTWLFVGSPNASAAALLQPHGNVECGLAFAIEGAHSLATLCDALVPVPLAQVTLRGREYPAAIPSPAGWIEDAVLDAASHTLRIHWRPGTPRVVVTYPGSGQVLVDGTPNGPTVATEFVLEVGCCELEIREAAGGPEARVPIRVENLVRLPLEGVSGELDLAELLLLHSGRITPSGLAARHAAGAPGDGGGVGEVFGAALTPREVFRALLSIGVELAEAKSLGAFQALLEGRSGVRRLAERLVAAPEEGRLLRVEAWVYGQELARVMAGLDFAADPTREAKVAALRDVVDWIHGHLAPPERGIPGLGELRRFYQEGP